MSAIKKRLKSKMHWLGVGTQVLGALTLLQANVHSLGIPQDKIGYAIIGVGIAINILREFTTKPVAEK